MYFPSSRFLNTRNYLHFSLFEVLRVHLVARQHYVGRGPLRLLLPQLLQRLQRGVRGGHVLHEPLLLDLLHPLFRLHLAGALAVELVALKKEKEKLNVSNAGF